MTNILRAMYHYNATCQESVKKTLIIVVIPLRYLCVSPSGLVYLC